MDAAELSKDEREFYDRCSKIQGTLMKLVGNLEYAKSQILTISRLRRESENGRLTINRLDTAGGEGKKGSP